MSALKIKRLGRFGNNVYQIYNAMLFANQIGIKTIDVSELDVFLMFQEQFHSYACSNGITLVNKLKTNKKIILGKFFHPRDFAGYAFNPDHSLAISVFSDIRNAMRLPEKNTKTRTLVCHLRSGDIFTRKTPKANYTQPPASFYIKAVEENFGGHDNVVVVYEDTNNPAVKVLCDWLEQQKIPFSRQSKKITDDIVTISNAKTVVCGKGTFVPMIVGLSGTINTVISFRKDSSFNEEFYKTINVKNITYIDKDNGYIPTTDWRICVPPTEEANKQLKMIVEYKKENIILCGME